MAPTENFSKPELNHDLKSSWPSPKPSNAPPDNWIEDLLRILCPPEEPWRRRRLESHEHRLQELWATYKGDLIDRDASALRNERDRLSEQLGEAKERLKRPPREDDLFESRKIYREVKLRVKVLTQILKFRDRYRTSDFCGAPELVREEDELGKDEKRAVAIGRALLNYGESEDETPNFHDQKERFKEWAGKVIERSGSTAYEALKSTGCWGEAQRGVSGTESILERAMEYAKQNGSRPQD